jgi:rod shape-determining protein MreC
MTTTFSTRAIRRRTIAFTILLATTLVLMAFSSAPPLVEFQRGIGFAFSPIQRGLDDVARSVSGVVTAIAEIDRLRSDNAVLRQENDRLRIENARAREVQRENDLLTGLLQLRTGFGHETVAAAVIARESSEFRSSVTLDRGTDDGLSEGDVVVAAGGALAGRIVEVGSNYAKVVLVNDGGSTVIGQLVSSATIGEVVGQLGGVLIMGKIDSSEQIQLGDEVVTAGLELGGGIRSPYPKGLLIGQVIEVRRDANDVVQTAFLQPAIDLEKIEFVLVITDYEGGLPTPDEQPVDCSPTDGTLPDGEQPCFTPTPRPSG